MIERGWTPLSNDDKTELTPEQMDKRFITSLGYNDSVVSALQKIGVDFSQSHTQSWWWNEKNLTAISDCIVIGTVTKKEYPLHEDAFFHTIAYVKVEQFLRNDYHLPKAQLPVMIASGPTHSGGKMIQEGEDTLKIGEHILLFLSASGLIMLTNDNHMYKLYDKLINNPIVRFRIKAKYSLVDGKVMGRNSLKDLTSVRDDISIVMNTIYNRKTSGN
jgi:hypothetical protein